MDTVQLVLLFVIFVLTVLLIILGIQVFLILKDLRKTITKANKVLDTADVITENVSGPLEAIGVLTGGFKSGAASTAMRVIKSFLEKDYDVHKRERE